MRILALLLGISLLFSCNYDVVSPKHDIDIGTFELLEESILMMPYHGKQNVVFQDSTGNELTLIVHEFGLLRFDSRILHYDVYAPGDTVTYHYNTESLSISLKNDSLTIIFSTGLLAKPYYDNPESGFVADVLNISMNSPNTSFPLTSVFSHVTNQRTWPDPPFHTIDPLIFYTTENIGPLTIFNKEFEDVLRTDYFFYKSDVFFNYEVGIVTFLDHQGKKWRFERFQ